MSKLRFHFFLSIFVLLSFSACTKNDSSTIVLLGTESYVDDILDIIPDSLITVFDNYFGEIPRGYVPPKIEGKFVVAPKQRYYSSVSNWPLSVLEPNMSLHFTNQHNSVVELNLAEATETFTDTVNVLGHDQSFTVYYQESKEVFVGNEDILVKRGIIITGTMCSEGIMDIVFANIIMDVEGDTEDIYFKPGHFFIYKDGDGLAREEDIR